VLGVLGGGGVLALFLVHYSINFTG